MYSTCTVQRAENEDVVKAFLAEQKDFVTEAIHLPWLHQETGMYTFWPHIDGTDGFFVAKLRKHV
jgi:16S rRNA (cytosine967-C5)-methyltransferase